MNEHRFTPNAVQIMANKEKGFSW